MEIKSDGKNLQISITVPLWMTGEYSYSYGKWEQPAVCIYINERMHEFGLFHTQYLDYKDSLQATAPIVHFDTREEALQVAEDFSLPVEFTPAQ